MRLSRIPAATTSAAPPVRRALCAAGAAGVAATSVTPANIPRGPPPNGKEFRDTIRNLSDGIGEIRIVSPDPALPDPYCVPRSGLTQRRALHGVARRGRVVLGVAVADQGSLVDDGLYLHGLLLRRRRPRDAHRLRVAGGQRPGRLRPGDVRLLPVRQ